MVVCWVLKWSFTVLWMYIVTFDVEIIRQRNTQQELVIVRTNADKTGIKGTVDNMLLNSQLKVYTIARMNSDKEQAANS